MKDPSKGPRAQIVILNVGLSLAFALAAWSDPVVALVVVTVTIALAVRATWYASDPDEDPADRGGHRRARPSSTASSTS